MLVLFERLAIRCRAARLPAALALVLMFGLTVWVLLGAPPAVQDRWLIPSVLTTLWLLLLLSGLNLFASVPAAAAEHESWWGRQKTYLHRGLYHLFAWFIMSVSVGLVIVSFQLIAAWFRMN